MKETLYGDGEHEPNPEGAVQLANDIYASDVLPALVQWLAKLDFEVISFFQHHVNNESDQKRFSICVQQFITSHCWISCSYC